MAALAESVRAALPPYLRALWSGQPQLKFVDAMPFIDGHAIHVPVDHASPAGAGAWQWYRAAVAHAAAHLAFSPPVFDGRGLAPISRALLGVLEDARIEALACRELPGLRRLWMPLHTASPADGDGFEALLLRLSRSLLDPGYQDEHPWIRKGRALFFGDDDRQILLLRRPDELRLAASLLGNDIGQMRLQFNSRMYVPGPDYRDDSRWMWASGQSEEPRPVEPPPSLSSDHGASDDVAQAAPPASGPVLRYPEFDRLIGRLRHGWCSVSQQAASDHQTGDRQIDSPAAAQALTIDLIRILRQSRAHHEKATRIAHEGDAFDIDAVVRHRVARRARRATDAPVYRRAVAQSRQGQLMMIIDQSASSSAAWAGSATSLLQASCAITASLASALQACSIQVAIAGFSSNGRHAVALRGVKEFDEPMHDGVVLRLAALRSQHSTRLGVAIRHATRAVVDARGRGTRQVVIVSDGLPWDVDVHDPRYLESDAHDAVMRARRQGVVVSCLVLDPAGAASARKVFGARRVGMLQTLVDLPQQVRRLGI
jgi:hypothetical protein